MVLQQVEDAVVTCVARAPQRIALVVLGGGSRAHHVLVNLVQVEGGDTPHRALDAVAVGVVDECRQAGGTLLDLAQAVLTVVDKAVGGTANRAAGLVAVGVVSQGI